MIEWTEIAMLARGGAVGIVLLMMWVLWRDHRHTSAGRIGILFQFTVICHVIATIRVTGGDGPPDPIIWFFEIGSNAAPGLFWLLARSWFDDQKPGWRSWALIGLSVGLMHLHAWTLWFDWESWVLPTGFAGRAAAISLVGLGLYVAWRDRNEDLIEERRRLRVYGIGAIGLYSMLVLIAEIGMRPGVVPLLSFDTSGARAWLMIGIFLLALAASATILATKRDDLFGPPKREEPTADVGKPEIDTAFAAKLDRYMTNELAWREDGLTISELARKLDTQEYLLRRLINRQLGHRNFAAFLNSYRLEEVRSALADPEQREVPILTIALDAGFGSLGTFNRAFRDSEKITPSEYRKARIG